MLDCICIKRKGRTYENKNRNNFYVFSAWIYSVRVCDDELGKE